MTSPERTLVDLGDNVSEALLEEALEAAIRHGLTKFDRVAKYLDANCRNGRRGSASLRRLMTMRGDQPPTGSPFETRFFALLRKSRLPLPDKQHEVKDGSRFICRVDFAYPSALVAIEADSWAHHSGRKPWRLDSRKTTELQRLGWKILRFTTDDLSEDSGWVVDRVRWALGAGLLD